MTNISKTVPKIKKHYLCGLSVMEQEKRTTKRKLWTENCEPLTFDNSINDSIAYFFITSLDLGQSFFRYDFAE
jgi:hypothetical protein